MQFCPRCGTQTDDRAPYCPGCGLALSPQKPPASAQPNPAAALNQTILAGGPAVPPAPVPHQGAFRGAPVGTIGMAQMQQQQQPPQPAPAFDPKHTMLIGGAQPPGAPQRPGPAMDPKHTVLGMPGNQPGPGSPPPSSQHPAQWQQTMPVQQPQPVQPMPSQHMQPMAGQQNTPVMQPVPVQHHIPVMQPAPVQPAFPAQQPTMPVQTGFAPQQPAPGFDPKHTVLGMPGNQQAPAPQRPPAFDPKGTVLGMPQQSQAPAPQSPASGPFDAKHTMLGLPPSAVPQSSQPMNQQQQAMANRTMLGVPNPAPAAQQPMPPQFAQPQQAQARPAGPINAKSTMLGVAVPGIAPIHGAGAKQGPAAHSTILGVAVPGIAPVHHGAPVAAPLPPPELAYEPEDEPASAPRSRRPRKRVVIAQVPLHRRPAFVLSLLAGLVAAIAIFVAVFWKSAAPIRAEARIDAKGQDFLQISCASCPDGTSISIEAAKGLVAKGVADVPLAKPLSVGENKFKVHIDRPSAGRDEQVSLVVPIAYRIRPDLGPLNGAQPQVHILIEAMPGTVLTVDGKPVSLSADGKGMYAIDVSKECSGQLAEQVTIDKRIPYEVKHKGGATDKGTVSVKVGVTPLILESPRPHSVISSENFLVAGRTSKGVMLEIEGTQVPASADGSFSRQLRVEKPGTAEVKVRALGKDQAPRTVSFQVKRVADLNAEAREFQTAATLDPGAMMADAKAHAGEAVVLSGEVVESRVQGLQTVVLLDATEGCKKPPCLVRVLLAGSEAIPKLEKNRIFGHVLGLYEAKGAQAVPEVDADFRVKIGKP